MCSTGHHYHNGERKQPLPCHPIVKKNAGCWLSSHSARDSCSRDEAKPPASVRPGDSRGKMRPSHVPTSSHRWPIGRVHGAGFGRRLLALRKLHARRLRPAERLTCRVHAQNASACTSARDICVYDTVPCSELQDSDPPPKRKRSDVLLSDLACSGLGNPRVSPKPAALQSRDSLSCVRSLVRHK